MTELLTCGKCGKESRTIASKKQCDKCKAKYVYNNAYKLFFPKTVECSKCHKKTDTITEHNVCDKCGTVYVYHVTGTSVFIRKEDFFPANGLHYIVSGSYYNFFWAKLALVILGPVMAYITIAEGEDLLKLLSIPWLIATVACLYSFYNWYRKEGIRGIFCLKSPRLSEKALEIKKKAKQRLEK